MTTISYTYEIERRDNCNFHGWIVLECSEYMEEEIFSTTSLEEAKAFVRDLSA